MPHKPNKANEFKAIGAGALIAAFLASTAFISGGSTPISIPDSTNQQSSGILMADSDEEPNSSDSADWDKVVKMVSPSLVSIRVNGADGEGLGSGVIFTKSGEIITNHHVVAGAGTVDSMQVILSDSSVYKATLVKSDSNSDLAVIKLVSPPENLTPITFAQSKNVQRGDRVIALGSPLGLSGTVTDGIVSAIDRPVQTQGEENTGGGIISALQTNAAINMGNSGGPLIDTAGKLVGINSSIATTGDSKGNIGIGFSIPSDTVRKVVGYLQRGESYPYGRIGITVSEGTAVGGGTTYLGALVKELVNGGAAYQAGLRQGDLIVALNGQRVVSQSSLVGMVHTLVAGDRVEVSYLRNNRQYKTVVTLGKSDTTS